MPRKFSPREINHLRHFGAFTEDLSIYGEKPVEYITGHAEFRGLDFFVTPAVLIPRIESEKIIDLGFEFLESVKTNTPIIADVGSGSGCLGISLVKKLLASSILNFQIYFSDISKEALSIAKGNCVRLLPDHQNRMHFIESDLLNNFPKDIKPDLIMANLPYIPSTRIKALDSSVKDFEPLLALDGGPDGTLYINKMLAEVPHYLSSLSLAIFEIDSQHRLSDFSIPSGFQSKIERDLFDRPRFLTIRRKL